MIKAYFLSGKEEVISDIDEVSCDELKRIEIDNHVFVPKRRNDNWDNEMESPFCIWSSVYHTCVENDMFYVYYIKEKARWIIDEATFKIVIMDSSFLEDLKKECIMAETDSFVPK